MSVPAMAGGVLDRLEAVLRAATVRVNTHGSMPTRWKGGTGFLVAPGQVVTCAHVLATSGAGDQLRFDETDLTVTWLDEAEWVEHTLPARVVFPDRPAKQTGPNTPPYPFPDLAVLAVDPTGLPAGWGCAWLGAGAAVPSVGDRVYTVGWRQHGAEPVNLQSAGPGPYEGWDASAGGAGDGSAARDDGHALLTFASLQVDYGMSGAALLSIRTGQVCGVIKRTRYDRLAQGGKAIPQPVLRQQLPVAVLAAHDAYHREHPTWPHLARELVGLLTDPTTQDVLGRVCNVTPATAARSQRSSPSPGSSPRASRTGWRPGGTP